MINRPLYIDRIMPFVNTPFIKILTGIRRCGKSTILKLLMNKIVEDQIAQENQIINFRFDSMEYDEMTSKEIYEMLKNVILLDKKTYLFLDEIQEVENWEKIVNSLMSDYDVDLYLTGSNSRMMSGEISTYLTGRYITFPIYTLSFREYLTFRSSYKTLDNKKEEFIRYLKLGGFPATHLKEQTQDEIYTIVKDIYNSTIFTDIVRRNQIRKIDQLERIVKYTFQNIGNTFSARSISIFLKSEHRKIDNETVYSYLDKLEKAYLIHRCSRYDLKGRELLKTQEKFYLSDIAFRYSVLGYTKDSFASSLENLVYLELLRRGYEVFIGKTDHGEIDFVANRRNQRIYIQVTQEIRSEETEKRECGRLLEIDDNYPKYLVSFDDTISDNYQGIRTMHIVDFLLSEEY